MQLVSSEKVATLPLRLMGTTLGILVGGVLASVATYVVVPQARFGEFFWDLNIPPVDLEFHFGVFWSWLVVVVLVCLLGGLLRLSLKSTSRARLIFSDSLFAMALVLFFCCSARYHCRNHRRENLEWNRRGAIDRRRSPAARDRCDGGERIGSGAFPRAKWIRGLRLESACVRCERRGGRGKMDNPRNVVGPAPVAISDRRRSQPSTRNGFPVRGFVVHAARTP